MIVRRKWAFPVSLLLCVIVLQSVGLTAGSDRYVANALTETRYMVNEEHEINGVNACKLEADPQSHNGRESIHGWRNGGLTIRWGIRVWWKMSDSWIELTVGTPVAQVSRSSTGQGLLNATWNCPDTDLNESDSIVIRVYTTYDDAEPWTECANFTTEQLGADHLESAVWKVCYLTEWYERYITPPYPQQPFTQTCGGFYWDYNSSKIENLQYSKAAIPEFPSNLILPIFMLATLLALMVHKRKHRVN